MVTQNTVLSKFIFREARLNYVDEQSALTEQETRKTELEAALQPPAPVLPPNITVPIPLDDFQECTPSTSTYVNNSSYELISIQHKQIITSSWGLYVATS